MKQRILKLEPRLAVRILCACAFGLSAYLLYGSLSGERLPGCGLDSGCQAVLGTRWAYLLGIPVSALAMALYAMVFVATFFTHFNIRPWLMGAGVALISAALYFVLLQLVIIGAICPFCMAAHFCGVLLGILLVTDGLKEPLIRGGDAKPFTVPTVNPNRQLGPVAAGFALIMVFAMIQLFSKPVTFRVQPSAGLGSRPSPRILRLHGNSFALDLRNTPLLGSPDAACVIVHLFDYTCPHCRRAHPSLKQAYEGLSNQMAVASLVVPMSTQCNAVVKYTLPLHANACELAYAALAVWRVSPEKFPAFDDWLFASPDTPSPESAQAKAMELVGTNQFKAALADPLLKLQLKQNIALYTTNYVKFRKSILPELIIGTNLVSGGINSADTIYQLVAAQYRVRLPPTPAK